MQNKFTRISKFIKNILGFGDKGHERTKLAQRNISASFLIKGANIAIGLVLVPLTIDYLNPTKYGIWITLSSIIGWFGFFDIGLGHGLRNKFAEALAKGEHELARIYVSTTYAILSIIIGSILILFFLINPFIDWNTILNVDKAILIGDELSVIALVVFTFFCLRFIFKLLASVLTADQRPAIASLFDLLGKAIALILIIILVKTTEGSLLYLSIALSSAPVVVLLISSFWFFNKKYKLYKPALKYVEFSKAPVLFNLGIKFFVIQIAVVLLYQTNNIIISHLFGPEQVTPYNVAFTYFSVLMMGSTIILKPFWSAFTEAWVHNELDWIKTIMQKLYYLWILLCCTGVLMLVSSKYIYEVWIGKAIDIPFSLSMLVGIWVLLNVWNSIFSHFLNGVGKLKLQLYLGIFSALINVPLAIYLGTIMGIEGVLLANILAVLSGVIVYPIQYKKLVSGKAKGIFNK